MATQPQTDERKIAALEEIARQMLREEMDDHSGDHADWQGAYEAVVRIARKALAEFGVVSQPGMNTGEASARE